VESDSVAAGEYHLVRVFQNSALADQAACCRFLPGGDRDLSAFVACEGLTQRG
jgi:hypothetical protein